MTGRRTRLAPIYIIRVDEPAVDMERPHSASPCRSYYALCAHIIATEAFKHGRCIDIAT